LTLAHLPCPRNQSNATRLQASLLSIKMFWAPELERERRTRMAEKTRAERAERVLKEQLEKGVRYMQKLVNLEAAYVRAHAKPTTNNIIFWPAFDHKQAVHGPTTHLTALAQAFDSVWTQRQCRHNSTRFGTCFGRSECSADQATAASASLQKAFGRVSHITCLALIWHLGTALVSLCSFLPRPNSSVGFD
jgi:hypothetical protein